MNDTCNRVSHVSLEGKCEVILIYSWLQNHFFGPGVHHAFVYSANSWNSTYTYLIHMFHMMCYGSEDIVFVLMGIRLYLLCLHFALQLANLCDSLAYRLYCVVAESHFLNGLSPVVKCSSLCTYLGHRNTMRFSNLIQPVELVSIGIQIVRSSSPFRLQN